MSDHCERVPLPLHSVCLLNYAFRPKYFALSTFYLIRWMFARLVLYTTEKSTHTHIYISSGKRRCPTSRTLIAVEVARFDEHLLNMWIVNRDCRVSWRCIRPNVLVDLVFLFLSSVRSFSHSFYFFRFLSSLSSFIAVMFSHAYENEDIFCILKAMCDHNVVASTPHRG